MTVGMKKAIFGTLLTLILIGIIAPIAFWFIAAAIDKAFGFHPILGSPASQILAAASILIGVFWISWSYSYLLFVGKGLPTEFFGYALHPTRYLVTAGPYAYVRNPMIIGLLFVLLGLAFLQGSIGGLILVPIIAGFISLYLVEFEEKGLIKRFGADYEEYRRNVPLLLPRITPYVHEPAAA